MQFFFGIMNFVVDMSVLHKSQYYAKVGKVWRDLCTKKCGVGFYEVIHC